MTQIHNEPVPSPIGWREDIRRLRKVGDCFIFSGPCQTIYSAIRREGMVGKISVRRDGDNWKVQRVKK